MFGTLVLLIEETNQCQLRCKALGKSTILVSGEVRKNFKIGQTNILR